MIEILDDEQADLLFDKSFVYFERGRLSDALQIRESLVSYAPSEERFLLVLAKSHESISNFNEAEHWFRKAIFIHPYSELSSLNLFHFLWDLDENDRAFEEMKRYQSIAHSEDYMKIVREINDGQAN